MSSDQLAFVLGAPSKAPAIDRLYFALLPDERAAEKALRIAMGDFADQAASGFIYTLDRLHVSVDKCWEGRGLPDFAVADASRRGARVELAPFEIRLDQLKNNGNGTDLPRVLTSREASPGFSALIKQIADLKSPILTLPHMTLYRTNRAAPEIDIPDPITWTARAFVLIHARKGAGTWKILERWPLR